MLRNRAVYIPSYNRVDQKLPIEKLLATYEGQVRVFVEPQEQVAYQLKFPKWDVIAVPESGMGIGYTRWFAQKTAFEKNELCIFLDDDVQKFKENVSLTAKGYPRFNKPANPVDTTTVLNHWFDLVEKHKFVGLQACQHLWTLQKTDKPELLSTKANTFFADGGWQFVRRLWTCYGLAPELYKAGFVFKKELRVFEDMELQMNCLLHGISTPNVLKYAWTTNDKRYAVRPGGCQSMDRMKVSEEMTKLVIGMYGEDLCGSKIKEHTGFLEIMPRWKQIMTKNKGTFNTYF